MPIIAPSIRGEPAVMRNGYRLSPTNVVIGIAALLLSACATQPASSRDNYLQRVELLALLQTLNADLLSHDSATLTLERWCGDHHLADPARVIAQRDRTAEKAIPAKLRARLAVSEQEPLRYRRVRLTCGGHVLSEADNWYVPARLSDDMNQRLETTDEPFGKVVRPLGFVRRTLSAEVLWSPLPAGWEMAEAPKQPALAIPREVLRHEAVLYTASQEPFSALVETYTSEVFSFRAAAPH